MKLSVEWLRELVPFKEPPSVLADLLTMAGLEIKSLSDTPAGPSFEAEITSNRPDWLSHIGVAREIAALTGKPLELAKVTKSWAEQPDKTWKLNLLERTSCPYYTAVALNGVSKVSTPDFMIKRLEACGQRSISFLVDVTNYVLLLTGQPLHAFDADLVAGREIQIRSARPGEKFLSIKGNELVLRHEDLVIADRDKTVALAGIMGGKTSEISESTQNVFLESAFFTPSCVRRTSQRTGLKTDSSYRFERRVDPGQVDTARDLAVMLICQYAKPKSISTVYRAGKLPAGKPVSITLSSVDIERHLGIPVPMKKCAAILKHLGLNVRPGVSKIQVRVPSYRPDLTRPIDLIEEVARIYGYDKIPETLNLGRPLPQNPELRSALALEESSRTFFSSQGHHETVTFSIVADPGSVPEGLDLESPVILKNPQVQELHQMRRTLLHSHLEVLCHNVHHQADSIRLFEIAPIYFMTSKEVAEEKHLALSMTGRLRPANWKDGLRKATFFDLKGLIEVYLMEHCGIASLRFQAGSSSHPWLNGDIHQSIYAGDKLLGWAGQIQDSLAKRFDLEDPVYYAELSLPAIFAHARKSLRVAEIPKYPSVERDIAFILDESIPSGDLAEELRRHGGDLLRSVDLFDYFQGGRIPKGKKNLAFRMVYQSPDRTLQAEEVHALHFRLARLIQDKFQATFQ